MKILNAIDDATQNILKNGKENVPFFLSRKQHQKIIDLADKFNNQSDNPNIDNCVIHTALIEMGLQKSKTLNMDEVFKICTQLRLEKTTEPRGPSGFVIAINTHKKIKDLARTFSIKNNEAHFVLYVSGLKSIKN